MAGHAQQAGSDVAQRKPDAAGMSGAGLGKWGLGVALFLSCVGEAQGFAGSGMVLRTGGARGAVGARAGISALSCVDKGIGGAGSTMQSVMQYSNRGHSADPINQPEPIFQLSQDSPDGPYLPVKRHTPPTGGVYQMLWLHNELVTAVSTEDLKKARELIDNGADPNVVGPSGWSAFHWAVQLGSQDAVRFLLYLGADCETRSLTGHTAVHRAAILGDAEMIELLVSEGKADVRARVTGVSALTSTRDTALHLAASFGHSDCATVLKKFGADVLAEDHKGTTARSRALALGNFEMADQLALWEAEVEQSRLFSRLENRMRNLLGHGEEQEETVVTEFAGTMDERAFFGAEMSHDVEEDWMGGDSVMKGQGEGGGDSDEIFWDARV
eukprot:CAMPEP_0206273370 /NCGR_PEP_ID=MMETSP0047_2-20121206/34561_1 /ASSEMBLY_ACC=CAM_ASM_000192 /TAXON_ID=195065 /ORGANISM="Chroomonas mesostigmatica_cf, Strain CCMP1168" /LENGTH=384 /DNA_ID=CAMNT_0053702465 /DNA_START=26 /DNA_END=1181 /DNA_ORIENTATION=-